MKKIVVLAMVAMFLISFSAVAFAGAQDFTLVNKTGVDIHYVYVAPHSSNDWGSDVMGKGVLMNGDSVDIVFSPGSRATLWDIRVEDTDGNPTEWTSFNLKEISTITLKRGSMAEYE